MVNIVSLMTMSLMRLKGRIGLSWLMERAGYLCNVTVDGPHHACEGLLLITPMLFASIAMLGH